MTVVWILVAVVVVSVASWAVQELLSLYFDNIPKRICAATLVIAIMVMLFSYLTDFSVGEVWMKICLTVAVVSYGIGILIDIYS